MALMDLVKELEGKHNLERRAILVESLIREQLPFSLQVYSRDNDPEPSAIIKHLTFTDEQGENSYELAKDQLPQKVLRSLLYNPFIGINVILTHGSGDKQIVVTSHHDAVTGSPGANDNASSVAVCIALYQKLAKEYTNPNNNIKIIMFDDEEPTNPSGTAAYGSRVYVKNKGIENIIGVYSLECCGAGDSVVVWPVISKEKDVLFFMKNKSLKQLKNNESPAWYSVKNTMHEMNVYYETAGILPSLYSDDLPFRLAGLNDAFCLAAVPKQDIKELRSIAENPFKAFRTLGRGIDKIPALLRYYHTSEDKSAHLIEGSMQMMLDVIYNTVVRLDAAYQKA